MMDIAITLALLPLALPMMAVCGLLIWLQDFGPVVFVQWRTGKHGKRFKMYKFRTMVKDAEKIKSKYTHLNQLTLPDFKIANDPRTTRLGRILRQTSLDEFPQLFNVLRGEMSLVGPRPTSFDLSTYSLPQTERLEVTPGVTGLWQLSGRSDIDFDRRLRLDMQYIESQSLWLDVSIMFKTLMVLTDHNGAY